MRSRKQFYIKPGEGSGFSLALPSSGTSANVEPDSDDAYVDGMVRQAEKKRQQQQPQDFRKYFYGRPAPRLPPVAMIKSALTLFDQQVSPAEEGTTTGGRRKLFNRIDCPLNCSHTFRVVDREAFLKHIAGHGEVQRYNEFRARARQDYDSMQQRRSELEEEITTVKTKARQQNLFVQRLGRQESGLVKKLAQAGQVDEASMAMMAGGDLLGDSGVVVVRENQELRELRVQLRNAEEKERQSENKLERLNVSLEAVEKKLQRFQECKDTGAITDRNDELAELLLETEIADPLQAPKPYRAVYLAAPFNRYVESEGGMFG